MERYFSNSSFAYHDCSIRNRSFQEWAEHGEVDIITSIPLLIYGIVITGIYMLFSVVFFTQRDIRINPFYRLMFWISFCDLSRVIANANVQSILQMIGAVFCRYPNFIYYMGCFQEAGWAGSCIGCFIIIVSRLIDVLNKKLYRILFGGWRILFTLFACFAYWILFFFTVYPVLFNSKMRVWLYDPLIHEDGRWGRMYLNDVKNNRKMIRDEESKLEEFRKSKDVSIMEDLKSINSKFNHHDLLNSLRKIEAQLENKLIYIAELQESEREVFNHNAAGDMTSSLNASNIRTVTSERNSTRIVPLKVPEFHGEYENYAEFIAGYDDLIHNNTEYSESAKCMYFKNAIRGKAARIISGIPATGSNYQLMYDKIKAKFSRASLNKHTVLLKLENLSPANENAQSLQDKIDDIEEILNLLNAANIGIDKSTDPMWHRLILRKFPEKIADKIVEEHHSDAKYTIRDMITSIENHTFAIRFREEASISKSAPQISGIFNGNRTNDNSLPGSVNNNHKPYSSWNNNTTYPPLSNHPSNSHSKIQHQQNLSSPIDAQLPETANSRNDNHHAPHHNPANAVPSFCVFCSVHSHTTEECRIPLHIKKIMENKACWKCFQTDHASHQCHLPDCPCGTNHHPTLCRHRDQQLRNGWSTGNRAESTPGNNNSASFQPASRTYNSERSSFQTHPVTIEAKADIIPSHETNKTLQMYHTTIESNKTIPVNSVLMTCRALTFNSSIQRYVESSVFFDSGSQRTIVSEKFATLMKLKIIGKEQCVFSGINGDSDLINRNIVEIKLKHANGNDVAIHAMTKSLICQGFNAAKLDDSDMNFVKENNINVDNSHIKGERICPDILIGADCYNKLMKNTPAKELPSGLRIVQTIFGSTIFGVANNLNDVKAEISTYSNNSCIVSIVPKVTEQTIIKSRLSSKDAPHVETTKSIVKTNTFRQSQNKMNRKGDTLIVLPAETISLLKQRSTKRKKLRIARKTSMLNSKRNTQGYTNKPAKQPFTLNPPNNSEIHNQYFLKKNKNGKKSLQTLNNTDGRIHPAIVHVESESEKVKTAVILIEKLSGKCIQ